MESEISYSDENKQPQFVLGVSEVVLVVLEG